MRVAPPEALHDDIRPALTAHLTAADVGQLFPVHFSELDSLAAPEPSRAALLRLESGNLVVVEYGTVTSRLTVSVPDHADMMETLVDLLREAPIPDNAIDWIADEIEAPSNAFAIEDPAMLAFELRRTIEKKRRREAGEDTQTKLDPSKPRN
jgi:hypothetical protein